MGIAHALALGGASAAIPTHDAWGPAPFLVRSSARSYRIVSHGCDCRPDDPPATVGPGGGTTSHASDIVFDTGRFVQFPDGTQR